MNPTNHPGKSSTPRKWAWLAIAIAITSVSFKTFAQQDPNVETDITSINGDYEPNHAQEIYVHPGDVITLSADLLDRATFAPQYDQVEDFDWSAYDPNTQFTETCYASDSLGCSTNTDFQTTDYGVTYSVPYAMGEWIQISVNSAGAPQANTSANNTIVLRNANWVVNYVAPAAIVLDPFAYPYDTFTPDYALVGMGHWVWVEGVRYFVPNTYVGDDGEEWRPYRHGYWSWDLLTAQWTWISYDPWGWMTDHYGIWRYHGDYGWIWLPFDGPEFVYHPHCVSWFLDGGHFGWYPYFDGYADGYVHGFNEGFRDGFEEGLRAGLHIGDIRYHGGFTVVNRTDIMKVNIYNVSKTVIINKTIVENIVKKSVVSKTIYKIPGNDAVRARTLLDASQTHFTNTSTIVKGNEKIVLVKPTNPVPAEYKQLTVNLDLKKPLALGTVNRISEANPQQHFEPIAPTSNGKAIVSAPVTKDAKGNVITIPSHSSNPAIPSKENPVTGARPVNQIPATHPTVPAVNPHGPPPPPLAAKPSPKKPAPVIAAKPVPPPQAPPKQAPVAPKQGPAAPVAPKQGPAAPVAPKQGPAAPVAPKQGPAAPVAPKQGPAAPVAPKQGPAKPVAPKQGPAAPVAPKQGPVKPVAPKQGPAAPPHQGAPPVHQAPPPPPRQAPPPPPRQAPPPPPRQAPPPPPRQAPPPPPRPAPNPQPEPQPAPRPGPGHPRAE